MLEDIPATVHQGLIFRLVNQAQHVKVLTEMGLQVEDISEMVALLRERGVSDEPVRFLDGPFELKPFYSGEPTRFSDGSVRVFYSALDADTTEREIRYWYLKPLATGQARLTVYYRQLRCSFEGRVKDLRPRVGEWPFLVADDGYPQCNQIGAEANASGIGGLLSQSARHAPGTTLPVFARGCLSAPELQEYRALHYDPANGSVTVTAVP